MQVISHPGFADQTINKSRFIAVADYCADERAVMELLRGLAHEHAHANHLVFAYKVQNPGGGYLVRFHDAGEPCGTAGKPILQYIEGRDLVNVWVAMVRYFGGVKLGTGG
ncbi:MAG TPA: YigZ family protein, partial [Methylophilaceae bacterium]|nr:YigZ family protein [Methylophilaceae bacterium]